MPLKPLARPVRSSSAPQLPNMASSSSSSALRGGTRLPPVWDASAQAGTDAIPSYDAALDKHLAFAADKPKTASALRRLTAQREHYAAAASSSVAPPPLPPELQPSRRKQLEEPEIRPDEVFVRTRDRLLVLWDELDVDEAVREHFKASVFQSVTAESVAVMTAEIQRLLLVRATEHEVRDLVEVREGFVYLLMDVTERTTAALEQSPPSTAASPPRTAAEASRQRLYGGAQPQRHASTVKSGAVTASDEAQLLGPNFDRQVRALVGKLRTAAFNIVHAVVKWREALAYDAVFLWRGVSYLEKMKTDLSFVLACPVVARRIPCAVINNPLLDPTVPAAGVPTDLTSRAAADARSRPVQHGPTGFTRDEFERNQATLDAETALWARHVDCAVVHSFDAADDDIDEDGERVAELIDTCFFHPPDELTHSKRRHDEGVTDRMLVVTRVIKIQRAVRRMLAARHVRLELERHRAATRIQTVYRRFAAKKVVAAQRRRYQAAVKIQARIRGIAVRRVMETVRDTHGAATSIARVFRGHRTRESTSKLRLLNKAATKIQALVRGVLLRQLLAAAQAGQLSAAATEIQRVWKAARLREAGTADPKRQRAARAIQRCWRGHAAAHYVAFLRGVNDAARRIQRITRCVLAKRELARRKALEADRRDAVRAADDEPAPATNVL